MYLPIQHMQEPRVIQYLITQLLLVMQEPAALQQAGIGMILLLLVEQRYKETGLMAY